MIDCGAPFLKEDISQAIGANAAREKEIGDEAAKKAVGNEVQYRERQKAINKYRQERKAQKPSPAHQLVLSGYFDEFANILHDGWWNG